VGRATVLVVDDEHKIREVVCSYLEREDYAVLQADTGQRRWRRCSVVHRTWWCSTSCCPTSPARRWPVPSRSVSRVPIIILTAKADPNDRVAGLKLGADDYVVKPFSPRELVTRVEAVLRRADGGASGRELSQRVAGT
jgi:DNA-binding response OmpR family regulator